VYGLHVHIGVKDGDEALKIAQAAQEYLPHLLALSANSPYWQGVDTGMQSSRVNIMESFPFAGPPRNFQNWKEFEIYFNTLRQSKAITTLKDLYWHIRPNITYGTIEFRICDAMTTLDETLSVVALIQCLVVWMSDQIKENPDKVGWSKEQEWLAPENQWIAARDGFEAMIVTRPGSKRQQIGQNILRLVETLSPYAKRLNCFEELVSLKGMIQNGNGAQRQRNIFQSTGSLQSVVSESIGAFCNSFESDYSYNSPSK
jgi:carboxylate-amine ligase